MAFAPQLLRRQDFGDLLHALVTREYRIVGPTIRDGAIVYDEIRTDEQDGGTYRLEKRDDAALFGYVDGPHAAHQLPSPGSPHAAGPSRPDPRLPERSAAADEPRRRARRGSAP